MFLQVCVTHFEYWLHVKFSLLAARPNKFHPGGEIFCMWMRGNNIFFPVERENNRKTILIWTAPMTLKYIVVKFVVLLQIIFVFFCLRFINFFAVRLVHYRICLLNTYFRNIKDLVIIFLFYLRKYKEKEKKLRKLLKVTGRKSCEY